MGRGNESLFGGWGGGLGHMTKMTTIYYVKNPLKIFFSGTKGSVTLGLVCSIGDLVQMMTLTFFYGNVKFATLCFYMGKYTFLQEKCK